ncbi:hypothetical protein TUM17567_10480 [Citrobacter amalonaticus]|nr:hypothetical protein TUM17567_10480 [Citrobacter amalonaticus]
MLTMIINCGSRGADLLDHEGKVGSGRELVDVLVNVRGLDAERYTGGQSDDKSGKSHNLALTTWKQADILRRNALESKR